MRRKPCVHRESGVVEHVYPEKIVIVFNDGTQEARACTYDPKAFNFKIEVYDVIEFETKIRKIEPSKRKKRRQAKAVSKMYIELHKEMQKKREDEAIKKVIEAWDEEDDF